MRSVLHLPFPPSVNSLYDGGMKSKRRFTSERYLKWQADAHLALLTQPDRFHRWDRPVQVTYLLTPPDKRRRDAFNCEKALSDLLVAHQILADDSLIHRGIVEWHPHEHPATAIIEPFVSGQYFSLASPVKKR